MYLDTIDEIKLMTQIILSLVRVARRTKIWSQTHIHTAPPQYRNILKKNINRSMIPHKNVTGIYLWKSITKVFSLENVE